MGSGISSPRMSKLRVGPSPEPGTGKEYHSEECEDSTFDVYRWDYLYCAHDTHRREEVTRYFSSRFVDYDERRGRVELVPCTEVKHAQDAFSFTFTRVVVIDEESIIAHIPTAVHVRKQAIVHIVRVIVTLLCGTPAAAAQIIERLDLGVGSAFRVVLSNNRISHPSTIRIILASRFRDWKGKFCTPIHVPETQYYIGEEPRVFTVTHVFDEVMYVLMCLFGSDRVRSVLASRKLVHVFWRVLCPILVIFSTRRNAEMMQSALWGLDNTHCVVLRPHESNWKEKLDVALANGCPRFRRDVLNESRRFRTIDTLCASPNQSPYASSSCDSRCGPDDELTYDGASN